MKIEHLEYLVYFAHAKSVTATASHFYMTKQGMNKALHQLESDSGYVLFENGSSGLRLTKAGEEFVLRAEAIVGDMNDLRDAMRIFASHDTDLPGSAVIVSATPAAMRYLLPQLNLQNPGMFPFEIYLREMSQREIAEMLTLRRSERILGLLTFPAMDCYWEEFEETLQEGDLIYDELGTSDVYALVSTSSMLSHLDEFDIHRDLAGQKVGYLSDEMLRDALDDYVRDEDIRTVTGNIDLLDEQIVTNRLITFAPSPRLLAKHPPRGIAAIPCSNDIRVRFGLVRTKENRDDADILQVVTRIKAALSANASI